MDPVALWLETPITGLSIWDWRKVQEIFISPVEEPLVPVSLIPDKIISRPEYFIQGLSGSLPDCFVRERVLALLVKASRSLPEGCRFVIFDGWRSRTLQSSLFQSLKEELQKEEPQMRAEELEEKTCQYVALPSRNRRSPSPHSTGGSVDISISGPEGMLLDMGTVFDTTSLLSGTRYYEKKLELEGNLNERESLVLKNRRLLYHVMTRAGFTNYPDEWWHFDYGNQNWAYVKGNGTEAFYGETIPEMRWKKDF
ncbi:MAG: M15 family metallopeptidase [Synergistales bacterium]|nr:M15 family metallopeptidase [Synergistales bacterium]